MADPITNITRVSLPGAGQTQTYTLEEGTPVKFTFDIAEAVFTGVNGSLEIAIEDGGTIIFTNYQELADADLLPTFETVDGEQVAGNVYMFAFESAEETAEDLETAADGAAGGSGAGEYSDDPGSLFDGVDALGGQGDAYAPRALVQLEGVIGNDPPVAADDIGDDALEAGDHDLVPGKYINWVYPEFQDEGLDGGSAGGLGLTQGFLHDNLLGWDPEYEFDLGSATFLPLAGGEGGILIYNPNPPQEPYEVDGNVMDNDYDPNNDAITMSSIDFLDDDHFGNNPGPEGVAGPTAVTGKYGVLVIEPDGSYTYTLNQDWADILDEGDSYDEVFQYTIVDAPGAVSNTATLTITVFGSNDMPVATQDLNVQAVEDGDSTGYQLGATVDDPDDGTDDEVTVHDEESHDYTTAVNTMGNVLTGDAIGGGTDSDPDDLDQVGDGSLFVVGIYSHHTDTVDYAAPGESGTMPADHGPAMHPDQAWDQATPGASSFSVAGNYGVLTINADGGYTYTLYNEASFDNGDYADLEGAQGFRTFDDLGANLNALNYDADGKEDFTYGIMDDSGAFSYATITFTVNGANDAPVAENNVATAVEFGAEHFLALGGIGETDQTEIDTVSTVEGNVIANDTDVDDANIFVADAYTKNSDGTVKETHNVYTDAVTSDGTTAQQVTLQGQYGTLTINADGSYTYVADNSLDAVNELNTNESLTDTFYYTARNSYDDGVVSNEATLDITIQGTNDAPTDADFFVAGDFGAEGGMLIPFSQFDNNITDPEDDRSGTDGWESSFRIESLPDGGTLYYDGNEVQIGEVYDLNDPIGQFTYVPDEGTQKGVLLGSRLQDDSGLSTWGDQVNNQTREMQLDLDDDGNSDVTITTSMDSSVLKSFTHQANHIGHGLGNRSHNGIDMGETLSVDFNGTAVAYAEVGFDGLGNYFNPDSQQDAHATWVAYNGAEVVAWGMVNNDQMFVGTGDMPTDHAGWKTATMVSNVPDGTPGNQGDLFQSFVLDQSVLNGATFDRIDFGTTDSGVRANGQPRDWNSNWELRYVDVEFAGDHSFTYTAVDSNGQDDTGIYDGPATVTILPDGPFNEAPEAEPDLLVTNEDAAPSHGSVGLNDVDFDDTAHELTFVLKDAPPAGLTFNADGTYTFDPSAYQYLGMDDDPLEFVLNYEVYDNGVPVKTDDTTLTIVVEPRNDAPTLDLSGGTVTFEGESAGYNNMLGVYTLDAQGNPMNPEIIIASGNDPNLDVGDVVASYGDGEELHYFLVDVGYGSTPSGTPEFVWNDATGQWDISFDNGTPINVRFDNMALNGGDPEVTFKIEDLTTGRGIRLDDQFETDPGVGYDDDDYNDLRIEEHDNPGSGFAATFVENGDPISITGEVDINDIDNGAAISKATITYMPVDVNDTVTVPNGWTVTTTTDPVTGEVTMVITPESGIGTYEDILEGITFVNSSDAPIGGDRVFTITVTDNEGADSNPATSTITVVPTNDAPTLDLSGGTVTFEGETAGYNNMLGVYVLDSQGNPINPEIIIANGNDPNLDVGDVVASYGDGEELHYFLVDVGYGSTPQGTPEFVWNDATGQWDISFDNGNPINVRFDDMALNGGDPEVTFKIEDLTTGRALRLDDQFETDAGVGYDDDDYIDLRVEEHDNPGSGYAATFVENDNPISIAGEVDINDVDPGAAISKATITYMPVDANDVLTVPDGWTVTTTTDPGTGEVTMVITPESGLGTYEDILEGITFSNSSDAPVGGDRVFTVTVTDNEGADSNSAISTITVVPTNDPPVAGDDLYHEVFVQPPSTSLVTTEASVGGAGGWNGANNQQSVDLGDIDVWASPWGVPQTVPGFTLVATGNSPHLRVQSWGEPNNDSNVDFPEQINVGFDDPQSDVTLNLGHLNTGGNWMTGFHTADKLMFVIHEAGNPVPRIETVLIHPTAGHPPNDPSFDFSSATGITQIEVRPLSLATEFTLMGVDYTSTQMVTDDGGIFYGDIHEGSGLVGNAAGNVLANDYDVDSNPLEVLEAKADNGGWTDVDAEQGDAQGTLIRGEYGDLRIYENGEFTYELRPEVLELDQVPESETFEYRVPDLDGGTDSATLTFQIHDMSDPDVIAGTAGNDTLHGDGDGNSLFGLAGDDVIYGHAGSDLISGGSGDDTIYGQGGRDTIYGGDGDDTIYGSGGRDTIWGGAGDDTIYGGGGDDKLFISEGADVIHVANGGDVIVIDPAYIGESGANATVLNFESGSDLLQLGDLTGKEISVDEVNSDLRITFANPGGGTGEADIVVTLEGVSIDQFNGGVDISDNAELNQMIQGIIDSGTSTL